MAARERDWFTPLFDCIINLSISLIFQNAAFLFPIVKRGEKDGFLLQECDAGAMPRSQLSPLCCVFFFRLIESSVLFVSIGGSVTRWICILKFAWSWQVLTHVQVRIKTFGNYSNSHQLPLSLVVFFFFFFACLFSRSARSPERCWILRSDWSEGDRWRSFPNSRFEFIPALVLMRHSLCSRMSLIPENIKRSKYSYGALYMANEKEYSGNIPVYTHRSPNGDTCSPKHNSNNILISHMPWSENAEYGISGLFAMKMTRVKFQVVSCPE